MINSFAFKYLFLDIQTHHLFKTIVLNKLMAENKLRTILLQHKDNPGGC